MSEGARPDVSPAATVVVRTVAGPWGPLHLAASTVGIVAAESLTTIDAFAAGLSRRRRATVQHETVTPWLRSDPRRRLLDRASAVVEDFVAGRPPADDVPVDLSDRPAWDRAVLDLVRGIRWGRTASYGDIAASMGVPRAARAVGGALGRNPVALLIPCHRVIAADGTIGGYGGDAWGSREDALERKRLLLRREGRIVPERPVSTPGREVG